MDAQALLRSHRNEILALAARNGASNIRVFGSVARGDDTPESDIDFLVNLQADRSLLDLARLMRELQAIGKPASYLPDVDAIVNHVVKNVQGGDVVCLFSNGSFGGIHDKLLKRLGAPSAGLAR